MKYLKKEQTEKYKNYYLFFVLKMKIFSRNLGKEYKINDFYNYDT